ncbi:HlyD family efflux transporter periplasmic adaptor subunit [Achromobacter xylosoxidans]
MREVMLAPDTAGRVTAIHFTVPGRPSRKGPRWSSCSTRPSRPTARTASAKADFALLQLRRSQGLAPSGAESREVLEQRKAEAAQAVAAVRQLDARIEQKRVQAPFAGQIGIRRVNVGQYLNAGEPVATLTQLDPLYVNFTLPQQDLPRLAPGATVQVSVDAVLTPRVRGQGQLHRAARRQPDAQRHGAGRAAQPRPRAAVGHVRHYRAGVARDRERGRAAAHGDPDLGFRRQRGAGPRRQRARRGQGRRGAGHDRPPAGRGGAGHARHPGRRPGGDGRTEPPAAGRRRQDQGRRCHGQSAPGAATRKSP